MSIFVFLIWGGGFDVAYDRIGFWRAWVWPFYAGKKFARLSIDQIGGDA